MARWTLGDDMSPGFPQADSPIRFYNAFAKIMQKPHKRFTKLIFHGNGVNAQPYRGSLTKRLAGMLELLILYLQHVNYQDCGRRHN